MSPHRLNSGLHQNLAEWVTLQIVLGCLKNADINQALILQNDINAIVVLMIPILNRNDGIELPEFRPHNPIESLLSNRNFKKNSPPLLLLMSRSRMDFRSGEIFTQIVDEGC